MLYQSLIAYQFGSCVLVILFYVAGLSMILLVTNTVFEIEHANNDTGERQVKRKALTVRQLVIAKGLTSTVSNETSVDLPRINKQQAHLEL